MQGSPLEGIEKRSKSGVSCANGVGTCANLTPIPSPLAERGVEG